MSEHLYRAMVESAAAAGALRVESCARVTVSDIFERRYINVVNELDLELSKPITTERDEKEKEKTTHCK